VSRNFHARLVELGVKHHYREISGQHDWATVLAAFPAMFDFANNLLTSTQ
jgi:S-formylglutathione hydrolase FrmB